MSSDYSETASELAPIHIPVSVRFTVKQCYVAYKYDVDTVRHACFRDSEYRTAAQAALRWLQDEMRWLNTLGIRQNKPPVILQIPEELQRQVNSARGPHSITMLVPHANYTKIAARAAAQRISPESWCYLRIVNLLEPQADAEPGFKTERTALDEVVPDSASPAPEPAPALPTISLPILQPHPELFIVSRASTASRHEQPCQNAQLGWFPGADPNDAPTRRWYIRCADVRAVIQELATPCPIQIFVTSCGFTCIRILDTDDE